MFATKKEARSVVAGLSRPSKMPCPSYGLPASACHIGSKLREIEGSTCSKCYAHKGMYQFANVQAAQRRRLEALMDIRWVPAMVHLLKGEDYFRWHDSGDIMGQWHLDKIIQVCKLTPKTKHWMPTRESRLIKRNLHRLPKNLIVRVSATMIDGPPPKGFYNTSSVHRFGAAVGTACPAPQNNGECGDCRMCWDGRRRNISYHFH